MQDLGSWRADSSQADEALHKLDAAGIDKARGAAQAALDALMLTDAPLMYSPSLIALAALRAGFRKVWYSCCSLLFVKLYMPSVFHVSTHTNGGPCVVAG